VLAYGDLGCDRSVTSTSSLTPPMSPPAALYSSGSVITLAPSITRRTTTRVSRPQFRVPYFRANGDIGRAALAAAPVLASECGFLSLRCGAAAPVDVGGHALPTLSREDLVLALLARTAAITVGVA